jgi:hypothetical protein
MGFCAPLLMAALAATGTIELGLRSEVRGVGGSGANLADGAQQAGLTYEVDPSASLRFEATPRVLLIAGYVPRILMLTPRLGDPRVDSTSYSNSWLASAQWGPVDQLKLGLSGAVFDGVVQTTPLAQLSGATSSAQPGQPTAPTVDPTTKGNTGRFASQSARASVEWVERRTLRFGASAGVSNAGGVGTTDRALFPARLAYSADASATASLSARDDLALRAAYDSYHLERLGSVALLGLSSRWDLRLAPGTATFLAAGLTATLHDSTGTSTNSPFGRYSPQFDAGISRAAPEGRPGFALAARLGYAPYLNPYANEVLQRFAAQAAVEWRPTERVGLSATVLGAQSVRANALGPSGAASELGVRYRQTGWDLGMGLRAGVQKSSTPPVVGTTRQWGFFASVAWNGSVRL